MKILKQVGWFFTMAKDERIAALLALCKESPHADEGKIIGYLSSGTPLFASPMVEADVLSGDYYLIGPWHVCTDGEWAWPATLAYYVRHHHVALLEEFVSHMRSNYWYCPQVDISELALEGDVSMD